LLSPFAHIASAISQMRHIDGRTAYISKPSSDESSYVFKNRYSIQTDTQTDRVLGYYGVSLVKTCRRFEGT